MMSVTLRRRFHVFPSLRHENPLGLPRTRTKPPEMPRRGGLPQKRPIPNVKKTVVVASGKGGVGKSTVAVNLALAMAKSGSKRVGILDLDIFGPSIPTLMGLNHREEPELTNNGALVPLMNHGIPCMSMGFLMPRKEGMEGEDVAIVWRGLMVQKATQQLLFDVDWRDSSGSELDALVIDMPPGTGDVPLTLGQLVNVDGAIIVSTPQDVALADVQKGIAMFRKVSMPITGMVLNQGYLIPPGSTIPFRLFGTADGYRRLADRAGIPTLAELPLVPGVSASGDRGVPYALWNKQEDGVAGAQWLESMENLAKRMWEALG
ncbi:P-loop containing nucleoside triphosphate hydrolase protein [Thelephora terrestris]|uniref:P-loop containing nucleoside triphosphate hydrolase protein n=1 Tax=Thelephora terrestris TaxID=56493 RepID=A0A9P6HJ66_9AGAM|nr:P-loop containing nucleoside triphosphate hydrolase protein [Thelephora terrestris]